MSVKLQFAVVQFAAILVNFYDQLVQTLYSANAKLLPVTAWILAICIDQENNLETKK